MKAGMIGLGAMGAAMAGNVATAGFLSAVWNRTADKCMLLVRLNRIFQSDIGVTGYCQGLRIISRLRLIVLLKR